MTANFFGAGVAERYDAGLGEWGDPARIDETADVLASLAGGGPALELGIGTGRIALPLAARGVPVSGIDLSEAMVAQLRHKPGGEAIPVAIGDFAKTRIEGSFALVYVVFNTIMNLTTLEAQTACVANAAAHLRPGGRFVVEVGVPDHAPLSVFDLSDDHVGIDEYEPATQRLVSHHFSRAGSSWQRNSVPFRSVTPAEVDLMAQLAGMDLESRWSSWAREPFGEGSAAHVSVWVKA